jgi:hypothetical protein
MSARFELAVTLLLYLMLAGFIASLNPILISVAIAWFLGGWYFVANSASRGPLADISFFVTWPIYLALEG